MISRAITCSDRRRQEESCASKFVLLAAFLGMIAATVTGWAEEVRAQRNVTIEVFARLDDAEQKAAVNTLKDFSEHRGGVSLRVVDLNAENRADAERLKAIAGHFRFSTSELPAIYGCNQVIHGVSDQETLKRRMAELLRIDVYVRAGCSRCANAKKYLQQLRPVYPAFEIRLRDIAFDRQAREDLLALVKRYQQPAASVPVFHFCNQLVIGFDDAAATGKRIEAALDYWTFPVPKAHRSKTEPKTGPGVDASSEVNRMVPRMSPFGQHPSALSGSETAISEDSPTADGDVPSPPLPPLPQPLPPEGPSGDGKSSEQPQTSVDSSQVTLPWFGSTSVEEWGLPLFTIVVGLVDGFNPCAMWVLLFLLSILVNLRDRKRILAVAGSFVLVSGAAYFAFMAAWLNVFLLVGFLRPIQIGLGILAIVVGSIHVKDFFAFKRGISLSIPESAKPGIYERTRQIVNAENLIAAIAGAIVLAILVNVVELLCTAGLPALYTQILAMQELATWKNYGYLLLYNVAYMFDDALMVGLVVVTLGKRKLQEQQGRWLKLVSGLVILVLGALMLIKPEWLM